jgi:hypothetical protein
VSETPSAAEPAPPLWKKLLALAVSLAVCALALEIYVRATWQGQWLIPRSFFAAPGVFSARLKPNAELDVEVVDGFSYHVSTNARGFRGPLVSSLADEPLRVVSVGDSLTFGWGMALEDHAMARFTRAYAAAHPERGAAHAFIAAPAWDPKDYYFAFLTEVRPTPVDLVVLGFFPGNDILPENTPRILDPKDAPSRTELAQLAEQPAVRFPNWVRTQLSTNLLVAKLGLRAGVKPPSFVRFDKDLAAQQQAWEATFFYLGALADAVQRSGAHFVILSYPSSLQVNAGQTLDAAGLDHTMPDRVLDAWCKKRGVDCIFLLEPLQAKKRLDFYWRKDRHMTVAGQEATAEILQQKLTPIVDRVWEEKQRAKAPER